MSGPNLYQCTCVLYPPLAVFSHVIPSTRVPDRKSTRIRLDPYPVRHLSQKTMYPDRQVEQPKTCFT
eukprot:2223378-Rhodomonas_salina.1